MPAMKMFRFVAPLLMMVCSSCHKPANDSLGEVETAASLSPGDIRANKYLFETQAGKDQVVIFRSEKYLDGELTDSIDLITNQRNQKVTFPVVFLDRSFFNQFTEGAQPGYIFEMPNTQWNVDEQFRSSAENQGGMNFVFQDFVHGPSRQIKIDFSIFTESYEKAKRDVPSSGRT